MGIDCAITGASSSQVRASNASHGRLYNEVSNKEAFHVAPPPHSTHKISAAVTLTFEKELFSPEMFLPFHFQQSPRRLNKKVATSHVQGTDGSHRACMNTAA